MERPFFFIKVITHLMNFAPSAPHKTFPRAGRSRPRMPFEVLDGFPRALGADVVQMEWCPSMDLLAILTSDSHLAVHRVTWQRLFLISR